MKIENLFVTWQQRSAQSNMPISVSKFLFWEQHADMIKIDSLYKNIISIVWYRIKIKKQVTKFIWAAHSGKVNVWETLYNHLSHSPSGQLVPTVSAASGDPRAIKAATSGFLVSATSVTNNLLVISQTSCFHNRGFNHCPFRFHIHSLPWKQEKLLHRKQKHSVS